MLLTYGLKRAQYEEEKVIGKHCEPEVPRNCTYIVVW